MFTLHVVQKFRKYPQKAWTQDGFQQFKNETVTLLAHETSSVHVDTTLQVKLQKNILPLIPSILEDKRKHIAFNREVVSQLIDIIKFLGQHSLAFRGHELIKTILRICFYFFLSIHLPYRCIFQTSEYIQEKNCHLSAGTNKI